MKRANHRARGTASHNLRPPTASRHLYEAARPMAILRDMDLLFLVNVAKKIDQPADEKHDGSPDRVPHVMSAALGAGRGNKEIKLPDANT